MGPRQRPHATRDSCYLVEGLTVALLPHLNALLIMDEKQPCFVADINKLPMRPLGEKTLSALQLKK